MGQQIMNLPPKQEIILKGHYICMLLEINIISAYLVASQRSAVEMSPDFT
jgi:hypothetical protein